MLRQLLVELLLLTSFLHLVHGMIGRPQPQPQPESQPQVPCFFIFGDSLSDSGNNNGLETDAKANFLPYGIDFPGGPTVRFTNGRTILDLIGEILGLENYIPPFSNASGQQILQGVNYASAAAGIHTETGKHVDLYRFGARKILVFGLGPLGCLPLFQVTGRCNEDINNVANIFNSRLKTLLDQLNHVFPDVQFVFVNTYSIISPIPSSLGEGPCCGVGQIYCLPLSVPCKDRDGHAFWDNAHFTEATNKILATRAFKAQGPNDTYPMDISQLVHGSDQTIYSGQVDLKVGYRELIIPFLMLLAAASIM